MTIIFQLLLTVLVLFSFVMVVAVPVVYASGSDSGRSNQLILLGSIVWGVLVVLVGVFNYFVV
ncbi:MAG: photosystem II reaction center protein PsbZ [Synechococcales cyanobacterium RU_4_20]|nr:photosystem II reaction center protein PsbZ [Synechococcales cyanobacterium RU_4_20]NJR69549.1 photosystem II reaction center protein PsbZ [Synechococcales cyanobacterium CRU_2_2]